MFKSRVRKLSVLSVLAVIALISLTFGTLNTAYAGSNGQQIAVYACSANRVIIQGYNQSGSWATYTLNKSSGSCGWYYISGWWWKGTVSLRAYYYVTSEYPYYYGQSRSVYVPPQQTGNWTYVAVPTPTARQWVSWRAQTWVNDRVSYNQSLYHDGYRQDCSGYINFVWQTGNSWAGDYWRNFAYQINIDDLQPGDALDNPLPGNSGHMVLFMGWVNKNAGTFTAYEETPPYAIAHTLTFVKTSATTGYIQYYPGSYIAIRKNGF